MQCGVVPEPAYSRPLRLPVSGARGGVTPVSRWGGWGPERGGRLPGLDTRTASGRVIF